MKMLSASRQSLGLYVGAGLDHYSGLRNRVGAARDRPRSCRCRRLLNKIISLTHCPYLVGAGSRSTPFFDTSGSLQMNVYTLLPHPLLAHYPIIICYIVPNR